MKMDSFDLSRVKAVLFDLDGTLIDTNELICDSWRYAVSKLTGREITDEEIRGTMGEMLIDSMLRIMPEIDPDNALEIYRAYQRDIFLERITLFEGTEEMLSALKKAGYKNALVTSRLRSSCERALTHFGLINLFDAILTASDGKVFKPDPEPIYKILEQIGAKPDEAMFVGDTVHDIEAGLAAGVFTVLVGWSYALPPEKRADAPRPDFVIEKLQDILTLVSIDIK